MVFSFRWINWVLVIILLKNNILKFCQVKIPQILTVDKINEWCEDITSLTLMDGWHHYAMRYFFRSSVSIINQWKESITAHILMNLTPRNIFHYSLKKEFQIWLSNFPTLCCSMNPIELKNQLISVDELTLRVATRQENSGSKIETFFFHLIRRFPFELNYSIGNVVALALFSTHPWDGEIAFLFFFFLAS